MEQTKKEMANSHDRQPLLSREDRLSQFMFGTRKQPDLPPSQPTENQPTQGINFEELMKHVDTLMGSYDQLKPLFQKVTPFVTQFFTKK